MHFSTLTFDDSGMYQCIAENHHGAIFANAELRVFGESDIQSTIGRVRDLKVTCQQSSFEHRECRIRFHTNKLCVVECH